MCKQDHHNSNMALIVNTKEPFIEIKGRGVKLSCVNHFCVKIIVF